MKKLSIALISIIMTLAFIPVSVFGEDTAIDAENIPYALSCVRK